MKRLLCIALSLLTFATFGQDVNTRGLHIQRPAQIGDAYNGGLRITRDASALVGGIPGHVNAALYSLTISGAEASAFEWNGLFVNENYSLAGENVAAYFQGNKWSTGPTWGAVSEVTDTVGAGGAAVGHEIDNWTTGPDNGLRLGLDVVVGDARRIRGLDGYGTAQATTGIHIGASGGTPWARWRNGAVISDYMDSGVVLIGNATRGIWVRGNHIVALDLSGSSGQTSIRLPRGGRIAFDDWDQYGVSLDPATQDLMFDNAGTPLMRLTPGGHLHLQGQVFTNGQ